MASLEELKSKIESFRKRYHSRQLVIGVLAFLILNSLIFLVTVSLEYQLWFGESIRTVLFFLILLSVLASAYVLIVRPLLILLNMRKGISDEEAANEISKHFPEIEDKLLNTLQLSHLSNNNLLIAAIEKKSAEFNGLSFIKAVNLKPVKKYALITLGIIVMFGLVSFISPSMLRDGPKRIVNFSQAYEKEAPFQFVIHNEE
ncbi:MAG: hypothetical protein AAFY41_15005, partial [Bacteroidota bacterium]